MTIGNIEIVYPPASWFNVDPEQFGGDLAAVQNWFQAEGPRENIPESQIAWLLAQGWTIDAVADDPNNPPQKKFTISRRKFNGNDALASILGWYQTTFNNSEIKADATYDDVFMAWSDTIEATRSHLDRAAVNHNGYEILLIQSLDSIVSQVETRANAMLASAGTNFDETAASLNAFAATLSRLGTGYDAYAAQMETILGNQTTSLTTFVARVAAMLNTLASDYSTLDAEIAALEAAEDAQLASHVAAFEAKLDSLETAVTTVQSQLLDLVADGEDAFTDYQTQATTILGTIDSDLTTAKSTIGTLLDGLDANIATHKVTYQGLINTLASDYTAHAATTRALLVNLGATELARINEQFDSLLAKSRQSLVDRGFYSSALVTQVDARVERERSEAITTLNDRLAREKVDHEHKLYAELTSVRDKQLAGEVYLHALDEGAAKYRAEWTMRLHQQTASLKQTVAGLYDSIRQARLQFIAQEQGVREKVFAWGQDAKKVVADGKNHVYQLRRAVNAWKSDNTYKLADALRGVRAISTELYGKELAARSAVDGFTADARGKLLALLNGYIEQYAQGVSRYAQLNMANGQFLAGVKENVIQDVMKARFQYCAGLTQAEMDLQQLMRYQLDSRNNLAVGLFRFMGDRKFEHPEIQEFSQMVLAMGDSGATQWVMA